MKIIEDKAFWVVALKDLFSYYIAHEQKPTPEDIRNRKEYILNASIFQAATGIILHRDEIPIKVKLVVADEEENGFYLTRDDIDYSRYYNVYLEKPSLEWLDGCGCWRHYEDVLCSSAFEKTTGILLGPREGPVKVKLVLIDG